MLRLTERTERAEARTAQAKTRIEQAETRTEQAETRTEQAKSRTEEAEARSEQAIRASELNFRRLFEATRDGILILEADTGRISDVNPFLIKMLGFSCNELVGIPIWEIGPFKDIVSNKVKFDQLHKAGYVLSENLPMELRDGRSIIVEFVTNVYHNGDRNAIQCNVRDVTERRNAEKALLRLATIVESSDDAIIGKDLDGIITNWNKGAEKVFGYSASEMVGTSIMRLVPTDLQDEERQIVEQIKSGKSVRQLETLRQARDGRLIHFAVTVSPIKDAEGNVIGASKVAHDITDLKAGEKKILQLNAVLEQRVAERTTELQNANQELEAFSYSVSHDLRAPLRHVSCFVKRLETDIGASLSGKSLENLKTISAAAARMGKLIDDLLAFSRLGRTELQKSDVDLDELVREAREDFTEETKNRDIVWSIHCLPAMRGDRALLRLVLINLISNALKFTSGRVQAQIEIGCVPGNDGQTAIFIRDNGAGFDPQYADKLFGVFQRLHSQSEFEGTGIGLANVQRIVQRHGGRAWAEGKVDCGATFYFSIPNSKKA